MANYAKLHGRNETPGPSRSPADRRLERMAELASTRNHLELDFAALLRELERRGQADHVAARCAAVMLDLAVLQERLLQLQIVALAEGDE